MIIYKNSEDAWYINILLLVHFGDGERDVAQR